MNNIIFQSHESFNIMDYHISHQKLLLRATIVNHEQVSFHNIDILFGGVAFMMLKPHLTGLQICVLSNDELMDSLPEDVFFLLNTYSYYKYFELKTEERNYYVVAASIKIFENTLDSSVSSIKKT